MYLIGNTIPLRRFVFQRKLRKLKVPVYTGTYCFKIVALKLIETYLDAK